MIKPDVVILTGDNSPHDDLLTSYKEVIDSVNTATSMVQSTLSGYLDTTFSTLGNHDIYWNHMAEFTPNSTFSTILKNLSSTWAPWLDSNAQSTFSTKGYYVKQLNVAGFTTVTQVISLNALSCDSDNLYMWGSISDPNDQIAFLQDELTTIEANN